MKKYVVPMLVVFVILGMLFSCSFGFEPVWKNKQDSTVISLALSSSISSSRSVMPGVNFLYIRTDGGPSGATGALYGPFSVSAGAIFKTTAVPAGTYSSIGLILSSELLAGRSVVDSSKGSVSFEQFLAMTTQDFLTYVKDDSFFPALLRGDASAALLSNVTVEEGKVNSIPVLLRPVTNATFSISKTSQEISISGISGKSINSKYVCLTFSNLEQPEKIKNLVFSFTPENSPSRLMLFDDNGTFLHGGVPEVSTSGASFIAPYTMQSNLFLFVQFASANLIATCNPSTGEPVVVEPLSSAKAITAFGFASPSVNGTIQETAKTVSVTVPFGTNLTALTPTITHTGATVSPANGVSVDFSSAVTYTVTAADGSTQAYTVTVTAALSPAKAITTFGFASPSVIGTIQETAKTVSVTVPFGTNLTALTPTITHTGATVSPASGVSVDFSSPVTYTVTAADGSTQAYTVTVTIAAASTNANLSNLLPSQGSLQPVFSPSVVSYTLYLANSVSFISFTPTLEDTTASCVITPSNPFSLPIGVTNIAATVTAQDGTTIKTYTVSVTREGIPDIQVEGMLTVGQPSQMPLANNDIIDFGWIYGSGTKTIPFTIKNIGDGPLNVTLSISPVSVYSIPVMPATPVLPGNLVTFEILMVYASPNSYSATLHITSDDPDTADFVLNLTGSTC